MARILIIDDDRSVANALQAVLQIAGNEVEIEIDADEGLRRAVGEDFAVVITDLHWHIRGSKRLEPTGLKLTEQLHSIKPRLPIILMTAYPAADTTIDGTRRGAYDYVTKPGNTQEMEDLVQTVRDAVELSADEPVPPKEDAPEVTLALSVEPSATRTLYDLDEPDQTPPERHEIRGKSRALQNVLKEIGRVASKPVTVLIRGETGTGKELIARALHDHSDRAGQPFVIVNCVAIPDALLESELFGHEQGSFTGATTRRIGRFEQAQGGTIFLDEIGDMRLHTQAKLLRVLQDKTIQRIGAKQGFQVDVRVIAATHRDLEDALENRQFRRDLYYRLNDAVIKLPALRDRVEDIPELVNFFLQQHAAELGGIGATMDPEVMAHLQQQSWPGNVRELRNAVRKALLLARGRRIDLSVISKVLDQTRFVGRASTNQAAPTLAGYVSELLAQAMRGQREDVAAALFTWSEREVYSQALLLAGSDIAKAAKWLGVSRPTMRDKIARYGIGVVPESRPEEQLV